MTLDGVMNQSTMAFLYQNTDVGTTGADGEKVEVRDVPATTVLSYTWQGPDSKANLELAKAALDQSLAEQEKKATSFRLLGYNGPETPKEKRTWELQALID